MKLLVDTHIWVWSILEPDRPSRAVIRELSQPTNEFWLSPISIWEVVLLHRKGRIKVGADVSSWVAHAVSVAPVKEAPVTSEVALALVRVKLPCDDPAHQFLFASQEFSG
jgi:PIN domain nuclease of toxin-antitoxin system